MTANLKRLAVQGVGWAFLSRAVTKGLAFLVFLAMANLLTPQAFGLVALSKSVLALVRPFVSFVTGPALVQRGTLEPKLKSTAFWISVFSGAIAMLLVGLLARPVAGLLNEPALAPMLIVLSTILLIEGLGVTQSSLLQRDLSFRALTAKGVVAEVVGGLVGLGLALGGYGLWSLVGQMMARQLAGTITVWIVSSWRPRVGFSIKFAKELLRFGYSVVGSSFVQSIKHHADRFIIGALFGSGPLGYYEIALRLIEELGQLLMGSIGVVAFPAFARLQADKKRISRAFLKAVELTVFLAIPAFVGLGAIAGQLIPTLVGSQWTPSVPVLRALIPLGVFAALSTYNGSIILALGKPNWNIALGVLSLTAGVVAILAASPYGLVTAAFAYGLSSIVGYSAGLWLVRRLLKFRTSEYFANLVPPLVSAVAMIGVLELASSFLLINASDAIRLGFLIAAGAATYIGLIGLLRPRILKEFVELIRIALPIRGKPDG